MQYYTYAIERNQTPNVVVVNLAHKITLISDLQLSMYESISHTVESSLKKGVNESFLVFLTEVQMRMRDLILSLGSLTQTLPPRNSTNKGIDKGDFFMYKLFQSSQKLCKALSESQSIINNSFENAELISFLNKSVIFYKQTKIVLRAHLR